MPLRRDNVKMEKGKVINMLLDKIYYTVNSLEGDYAYLLKEGDDSGETKCVARALLPAEIVEGTKLVYEMMEYSII